MIYISIEEMRKLFKWLALVEGQPTGITKSRWSGVYWLGKHGVFVHDEYVRLNLASGTSYIAEKSP